MRRIGMVVLALSGLVTVASSLSAQRSALREVRDGGGMVGANVVVAQPLGTFRSTGNVAAGISLWGVTSGGTLALRVDGGWMLYDSQYQGYGITTVSQIGTLGAGPQLTLGRGPLRFYGFATIGGSFFWSSVNGGCGCGSDSFLDGHFTTTTSAGGGILLGVSRGRTPIAIDLGVRGVRHDRVKYIPAGGITQNADGTFSAQQVETPVEQRVFQVGVSIGLR
jgi:hypothetical protein